MDWLPWKSKLLATSHPFRSSLPGRGWSGKAIGSPECVWRPEPYRPCAKSTYEMMPTHDAETKTFTFIGWVTYWRGRCDCSSPSTKVLHGYVHTNVHIQYTYTIYVYTYTIVHIHIVHIHIVHIHIVHIHCTYTYTIVHTAYWITKVFEGNQWCYHLAAITW